MERDPNGARVFLNRRCALVLVLEINIAHSGRENSFATPSPNQRTSSQTVETAESCQKRSSAPSSIQSLAAPVEVDLKVFAPAWVVPDAQGCQAQSPNNADFRELRLRPPDGWVLQYSQ